MNSLSSGARSGARHVARTRKPPLTKRFVRLRPIPRDAPVMRTVAADVFEIEFLEMGKKRLDKKPEMDHCNTSPLANIKQHKCRRKMYQEKTKVIKPLGEKKTAQPLLISRLRDINFSKFAR